MSDEADRIATLERELAELKAKVSPPQSTFVPMSDAEWRDQMHQLAERRMGLASNFHIDDLRAMEAACPTPMMKDIALRDARAPQGPSSAGVIPSSQQVSNVRAGGSTTPGYVDPRPLGPQPGIDLIDRGVNAALRHGPEWGKEKK
jgi:hypothetical protein